jgi:hypothetical protein
MNCYDCGSAKMRFSHLRVQDIPYLFWLKVPVRCHRCLSRRYVTLWLMLAHRNAG